MFYSNTQTMINYHSETRTNITQQQTPRLRSIIDTQKRIYQQDTNTNNMKPIIPTDYASNSSYITRQTDLNGFVNISFITSPNNVNVNVNANATYQHVPKPLSALSSTTQFVEISHQEYAYYLSVLGMKEEPEYHQVTLNKKDFKRRIPKIIVSPPEEERIRYIPKLNDKWWDEWYGWETDKINNSNNKCDLSRKQKEKFDNHNVHQNANVNTTNGLVASDSNMTLVDEASLTPTFNALSLPSVEMGKTDEAPCEPEIKNYDDEIIIKIELIKQYQQRPPMAPKRSRNVRLESDGFKTPMLSSGFSTPTELTQQELNVYELSQKLSTLNATRPSKVIYSSGGFQITSEDPAIMTRKWLSSKPVPMVEQYVGIAGEEDLVDEWSTSTSGFSTPTEFIQQQELNIDELTQKLATLNAAMATAAWPSKVISSSEGFQITSEDPAIMTRKWLSSKPVPMVEQYVGIAGEEDLVDEWSPSTSGFSTPTEFIQQQELNIDELTQKLATLNVAMATASWPSKVISSSEGFQITSEDPAIMTRKWLSGKPVPMVEQYVGIAGEEEFVDKWSPTRSGFVTPTDVQEEHKLDIDELEMKLGMVSGLTLAEKRYLVHIMWRHEATKNDFKGWSLVCLAMAYHGFVTFVLVSFPSPPFPPSFK